MSNGRQVHDSGTRRFGPGDAPRRAKIHRVGLCSGARQRLFGGAPTVRSRDSDRQPQHSALKFNTMATNIQITESRRYDSGAFVFREGDESSEAFMVRSGRVEVLCRNSMGQDIAVGMVEEGETFGETGLALDRARSASARALTDCLLDVMNPAAFTNLLSGPSGEAFREVLHVTSERLRRASARLADGGLEIVPVGMVGDDQGQFDALLAGAGADPHPA